MNRRCVVFLILCVSCSADKSPPDDIDYGPHVVFDDFPDSLYNGIYFDQPLRDAQYNLVNNGFQLIDSSGVLHYFNEADSTAVILPLTEQLQAVKIILRSDDHLYLKESLRDIFAMTATSYENSTEFAVYYFDRADVSFEVTLFEQPDYIRLNFEKRPGK